MLSGTGFAQLEYINEEEENMISKQTVYCENQWLVIQQRQNGFETNFNRTWAEYSEGFGFPRGDFWLGLKQMSRLTQKKSHKLIIELTDWSDQVFEAQYDHFEVGSEEDFYKLILSDKYVGNASRDFLDDIYYGKIFSSISSRNTFVWF